MNWWRWISHTPLAHVARKSAHSKGIDNAEVSVNGLVTVNDIVPFSTRGLHSWNERWTHTRTRTLPYTEAQYINFLHGIAKSVWFSGHWFHTRWLLCTAREHHNPLGIDLTCRSHFKKSVTNARTALEPQSNIHQVIDDALNRCVYETIGAHNRPNMRRHNLHISPPLCVAINASHLQ